MQPEEQAAFKINQSHKEFKSNQILIKQAQPIQSGIVLMTQNISTQFQNLIWSP